MPDLMVQYLDLFNNFALKNLEASNLHMKWAGWMIPGRQVMS